MSDTDRLLRRLWEANAELWGRLDAVEALHVPVIQHGHARCLECTRDPGHPVAWPCDTIRAAQGEPRT